MNTALTTLYYQVEDYFFRGVSSKHLNLDNGTTAYMSGEAGLNFLYVNKNTTNLEEALSKAKQFYGHENLSFDVLIPKKLCSPQVVNTLKSIDYTQQDKSVSMVIDLDRLATDKTINIDATTVIKANNDRLDEWMMPLIDAFESTADYCSVYAATHANALKNGFNFLHFSLYIQEKAISSITLSLNNGVARIDDVGTAPEFQGKGYATKLMAHALSYAKKNGAQHCFLEASDAGFKLYKKLGFEALFENNIYSKKP